jgi:inhibitor of cysteine peptidase
MKIFSPVILIALTITSSCIILCANQKYYSGKFARFGSSNELKAFLENRGQTMYPEQFYASPGTATLYITDIKSSKQVFSDSGNDYSGTNVQTQGVDEADLVKTDGEHIYLVYNNKVFIAKAYPAEEAAVLSVVAVDGDLKEIFVNGDRLVVFYENQTQIGHACVVGIYDVSERSAPKLDREFAVEGNYFSSRMAGDYAYVVIKKGAWVVNDTVEPPKVCFEGSCSVVSASEIYYSDEPDWSYVYVTILAINVKEDSSTPNKLTVLTGNTSLMYVSTERIYLAVQGGDRTFLYLIHFKDGELSQTASGQVPGLVLNQFSMDEYKGYFRITTTSRITDPFEPNMRLPYQNNLYIMSMDLAILGKLEGVAPGEQIHSTRFMGDVCYLVTFRKVDPFFAIDTSEPQNPRIMGELKITGFSDYLHPYDENHVIGVGKETVAADGADFSWYQGVKISLFDVSDMSKPVELAKYVVGDRGTDSPVLTEHKAFLFSLEKKLLVLPVSVAKVNESQYPNGVPPDAYGATVWQGAYVFTISASQGGRIELQGTVTHADNGNVLEASHQITRALFINDVLYTISQSKIKLNSLLDLSEIKELNLDS